jgi:flagellar biosynthesis GTPase FlhF
MVRRIFLGDFMMTSKTLGQSMLLVAMAVFLGCEQTATQQRADEIRNTSQRQADAVRDRTQQKADELRVRGQNVTEKAEQVDDSIERQADRLEEQGEAAADAIEAQGEERADQLEAAEDTYWRENYSTRPYVTQNAPYETYQDAYLFGWRAKKRYPGKDFDAIMADLERDWNAQRKNADQTWESVKEAARDAWNRG